MKKEEIIKELNDLGATVDETATNSVLIAQLKELKVKQPNTTASNTGVMPPVDNQATTPVIPELLKEETVSISKKEWEEVQQQLKMLYEVADKGRVFNYENSRATKKPFKVKLSVFNDKIIVGWRTIKDELIRHPQTGKIAGEKQEYELILLDKTGDKITVMVDGYEAFTSARYDNRIEVEVVSKKEDWKGNYTFDVSLPDGRAISMDSRFVN